METVFCWDEFRVSDIIHRQIQIKRIMRDVKSKYRTLIQPLPLFMSLKLQPLTHVLTLMTWDVYTCAPGVGKEVL